MSMYFNHFYFPRGHKLLFSAITATQLGYHYRVIARAFRPVAISRYNPRKCCVVVKMVPGDCHVASLLAMTVVGATCCHSYHIACKQQFPLQPHNKEKEEG